MPNEIVKAPLRCLLLLCAMLLPAPAAWGADGVSLSGGSGARGQKQSALRGAVQWDWQRRWLEHRHFFLSGYWDASVSRWHTGEAPGGPDDRGDATVYAAAFSPVLRLQLTPGAPVAPFVELGVGGAYLSADVLRSGRSDSRHLGSHWQFEDRGVLGVRVNGRIEVAYQRLHYSNLSLASRNQGVDVHLLMLALRY